MEEYVCPLCSCPMSSPKTIGCGHTYCGGCLERAIHIQRACPLCRAPTGPYSAYSLDKVLSTYIAAQCPGLAQSPEESIVSYKSSKIPLFIRPSEIYFPGYCGSIYVSEHRYKDMITTVLQGDHCFGVLGKLKGE